jgi:hypothetical protein
VTPTPFHVITVVAVMLLTLGSICAWGVRQDDERRRRRRPVFDCSALLPSFQAVGAAFGAAAVAFAAMSQRLVEFGTAFERAPQRVRPVRTRGPSHGSSVEIVSFDGREIPCESMQLHGVRYDRPEPAFAELEPGSYTVVDGTLHLDITPDTSRLAAALHPVGHREAWEYSSDAHRVAAIADAELEAWREFIDGCGR